MRVTIDGIIYQRRPSGGISRIYNEILPLMCGMDETLAIDLLVDPGRGPLKQSLPTHQRINPVHRRIADLTARVHPVSWLPPQLWYKVARLISNYTGGNPGKNAIWHTTFYTHCKGWPGYRIVTVYDMISELFPQPYNRSIRQAKEATLPQSDVIICISERTRQDLLEYYSQLDTSQTYVIPLGVSEIFRPLSTAERVVLPLPVTASYILYVGGRGGIHKNFDRLLQAYSQWKHHKDIQLVVVGRIWSSQEEMRLAELKLENHVKLLNDVDDEMLLQLYNQAEAFVYPSLYEGFGIPILEAMKCACPVIAAHIPTSTEVGGECPIYFDPLNIDSLINAFDRVLAEGRTPERIQIGLEQAKRYTWGKTAQATLAVYRSL
jgi:glycosyltransferase involved in cell wall biosynthesis